MRIGRSARRDRRTVAKLPLLPLEIDLAQRDPLGRRSVDGQTRPGTTSNPSASTAGSIEAPAGERDRVTRGLRGTRDRDQRLEVAAAADEGEQDTHVATLGESMRCLGGHS